MTTWSSRINLVSFRSSEISYFRNWSGTFIISCSNIFWILKTDVIWRVSVNSLFFGAQFKSPTGSRFCAPDHMCGCCIYFIFFVFLGFGHWSCAESCGERNLFRVELLRSLCQLSAFGLVVWRHDRQRSLDGHHPPRYQSARQWCPYEVWFQIDYMYVPHSWDLFPNLFSPNVFTYFFLLDFFEARSKESIDGAADWFDNWPYFWSSKKMKQTKFGENKLESWRKDPMNELIITFRA